MRHCRPQGEQHDEAKPAGPAGEREIDRTCHPHGGWSGAPDAAQMSNEHDRRFAQEAWHYERSFICHWPSRPESAFSIACRAHRLMWALAEIEPGWGGSRPIVAMRAFRPSDPGPVLEMTVDEFATFIDSRARDGPPQFPRPVSEWGYSYAFHNEHNGDTPLAQGMILVAGRYLPSDTNHVELTFPKCSPVWGDAELGLRVMWAMTEAWDCAIAWAHAFGQEQEGQEYGRRPWLIWTKEPPVDLPPNIQADPRNYPVRYDSLPHQVRRENGGILKIWP